jgi:DNA mismatch endonuclease, patch repair protein
MPAPTASSSDALRRMQRQRRRDTVPELSLRRELHRLGLGYRVDRRVLTGLRRRADLVFIGARVAVFVDGCFWHSCPQHATLPRANAEWWAEKLGRNAVRDRNTDGRLHGEGWLPMHVWEHEDMVEAAVRVRDLVLARRARTGTVGRLGRYLIESGEGVPPTARSIGRTTDLRLCPSTPAGRGEPSSGGLAGS